MKPTWWVHKVKVHQVIDAQFLQLQHDGAEIGPQDLWICVVLRHYRGTRAAPGTIYNESVTVLITTSCISHMSA